MRHLRSILYALVLAPAVWTLCGVGYRAKPRSAAREVEVVEASARLLSTLMAAGMEPPRLPDEPAS